MAGRFRGHSTDSRISCRRMPIPPTSCQPRSDISTRTSLMAEGSISLRAFSKSWPVTDISSRTSWGMSSSKDISGRCLRRTFIAASLQRADMSAPTKPLVLSARSSMSTDPSMGMFFTWISRISFRSILSGTPISISRSNLPGLLRAGSMASILFVAPITTTCPLSLRPSIIARSWATTLRSTSPVTSPLLGAMESSSSMNMIEGVLRFASSKISRSLCSDSP